MKIGNRALITNFAFFIVVIIMAGISAFQIYTLNMVYSKAKMISGALRDQVEADMMHDGLRADVLYALKLVSDNNYAEQQNAITNTSEHVENFNRLIANVKAANVSDAVNENIDQLKEPLDRYTKSANRITKDVFVNPQSAYERYKEFEEDFEYLEGAMSSFSSVIEAEFEQINKSVEQKKKEIFLLVSGSIFIALFVCFWSWYASRSGIVNPLLDMTKSMKLIAQGELDSDIANTERSDEIGDMANALQIFKENAIRRAHLEEEQKQTQDALEARSKYVEELLSGFNGSVGSVIYTVASSAEELQKTAQSMASNSEQTSKKTSIVASAAENASSNVASVAGASEELSASIREISSQVSQSTKISNEAQKKSHDDVRAGTTSCFRS